MSGYIKCCLKYSLQKPIYLISENASDANSNYSIYQANLRKLFNPLEDGNCLVIHVQNLKISALESTKPSIEKINQILLAKNYREDDIVSIPAPVLVVPMLFHRSSAKS